MRFRIPFGAYGCFAVSLAGVQIFIWLTSRHPHSAQIFNMIVWTMIAIQQIVMRSFVYWDVNETGLKERRLWRTREVQWSEITQVRPAFKKNLDFLAIDFARPAPMSDRGTITANPIELKQFIDALHKFAPQASIELELRSSGLVSN